MGPTGATLPNCTRFLHVLILAARQDDRVGAGIGQSRTIDFKGGEWTGGDRKKPSDLNVYRVMKVPNRKQGVTFRGLHMLYDLQSAT